MTEKPLSVAESDQVIKSGMAAAKGRFAKAKAKTVKVEVLPSVKCANDAHLKSGNDAAIAKQLTKHFTEAQTGMRRIVALGLFAWELKETQLKHGEFGAWLAIHCPKLATVDSVTGKSRASRALSGYMDLTKNVLEAVGFPTIEKYLAEAAKFSGKSLKHGGFLLIADKKVPDEVKPLRAKICELVDGKTQRSLFSEFKQSVEVEDETGATKPKRGRLPGCTGTTAEQREQANLLAEEQRTEELGIKTDEQTEWALANADDKNLGALDEARLAKLRDAWSNGVAYITRVLEARKGGAK